MFGVHLAKFPPTTHVFQYRNGRVVRSGTGLAFSYFAPLTTLAAVPIGATEAPFIFKLQTQDAQEVDVQGQILYRITDPAKTTKLADFTLRPNGYYASEDPQKLPERITNLAQVVIAREIRNRKLLEAIKAHPEVANATLEELKASKAIQDLGIEVMNVNVQAISPKPATAAALEAEAREELLKKADRAGFDRRKAAVEQERSIKEAELQTQRIVAERTIELEKLTLESEVALEEERKKLAAAQAENARTLADSNAYATTQLLTAYKEVDPKVLETIALGKMGPEAVLAHALRNLTEKSDKIGELNLTGDLLAALRPRAAKQSA